MYIRILIFVFIVLFPNLLLAEFGVEPVKLGMTLAELGAQEFHTVQNAPIRYRFIKTTRDGDLYEIDGKGTTWRCYVIIKNNIIISIEKPLNERYYENQLMEYQSALGTPKKSYKEYQNNFGAIFKGEVFTWDMKSYIITFEQYCSQRDIACVTYVLKSSLKTRQGK